MDSEEKEFLRVGAYIFGAICSVTAALGFAYLLGGDLALLIAVGAIGACLLLAASRSGRTEPPSEEEIHHDDPYHTGFRERPNGLVAKQKQTHYTGDLTPEEYLRLHGGKQ